MSNEFNLTVDKRELSNKGGRKRALKEGKIPGIYYSHDSKNSIPFYITKKEISKDSPKALLKKLLMFFFP